MLALTLLELSRRFGSTELTSRRVWNIHLGGLLYINTDRKHILVLDSHWKCIRFIHPINLLYSQDVDMKRILFFLCLNNINNTSYTNAQGFSEVPSLWLEARLIVRSVPGELDNSKTFVLSDSQKRAATSYFVVATWGQNSRFPSCERTFVLFHRNKASQLPTTKNGTNSLVKIREHLEKYT